MYIIPKDYVYRCPTHGDHKFAMIISITQDVTGTTDSNYCLFCFRDFLGRTIGKVERHEVSAI